MMSGSGREREAISLNGFFEAATTYLQLANKDSLLKLETNLQVQYVHNVNSKCIQFMYYSMYICVHNVSYIHIIM
jgi:hypothetical protein